jgi:predicted acylesterase/phospholipase RssA
MIYFKFVFSIFILLFVFFYNKVLSSGGLGFAITGAASRIGQEAALLEALVEGLTPSGVKYRPNYISGASSGALSAVALNAILQTEDFNLVPGFTWNDFKQILFNLTDSQVYENSPDAITQIFTNNIAVGYILNNEPLNQTLSKLLNSVNYKKLGDLYLPTSISVVNQQTGESVRLWSDDDQFKDLDLLEILMASTAIPVVFPTRNITGLSGIWVDGGTGIDTVPVVPLLQHGGVKEIMIISYSGALIPDHSLLPTELSQISILNNIIDTFEDIAVQLFVGGVQLAVNSSLPANIFIPSLNQTFSLLDFDHEQEQYSLAFSWASQNNPVSCQVILNQAHQSGWYGINMVEPSSTTTTNDCNIYFSFKFLFLLLLLLS